MIQNYFYPKSLDEALQVAGMKSLKIIAGGTELMPRIRNALETPGLLLDITDIGLDFVGKQEGIFIIGTTTPIIELEENPEVKKLFPALSEAASEVGGMQTRSLGTVGGNICIGIPSADLAIPLLAYDAWVRVQNLTGERKIKLHDFFLAPRRTALREGEIATAIELPIPGPGCGAAFGKIGRRRAMRLAVVNIAACLEMEGGVLADVRLAMGAVAPVPVRLYRTEEFLRGRELTPFCLEEATAVMSGEISPRSSVRASADYRREIAGVLLKRTLSRALVRALGGGR